MKHINLLFLSILFNTNLFSEIHEKSSIKVLHEHVYIKIEKTETQKLESKETVVVLDLDNTTFKPKNDHHASDQWFNACIEHLQKSLSIDFMSALDIVLPEYINLQKQAAMEPVEKEIVNIIAQFQKDKIPVMALTARSLPLEETTLKQLDSINIDFSINCLANKKEFHLNDLEHPCKYKNGILFVSNNDKGKALAKFLDHVNHNPQKIVYADDKLKHVQHVEYACKEKNIEFVGIRYSYCDEKVKSYKLLEQDKVKISKLASENIKLDKKPEVKLVQEVKETVPAQKLENLALAEK